MLKQKLFFSFLFFTLSLLLHAQDKLKQADELFAAKKYREALTIYKQELSKAPDNVDLILKTAKASLESINYSDALELYERAIKLDSKSHIAYYEKAKLLSSVGMLKESQEALDQAIKILPEGEYHYWRGIVHQQQKHLDKALSDYDAALSKGVRAPELYNNYAILLVEIGRPGDALININKAISMDSTYPEALSARAKIHFLLLDVDSACIDSRAARTRGYKQAFDVPAFICSGSYALKMQYAGEVLMQGGHYAQAIEAFTRVIESKVDSASVYHNRGYCYYNLKEYAKAEADYLKALSLPRTTVDLLYDNLSLLYFDQNMFEKSIEYSGKRIALNPANPTPYIDRGLAYRKLKKYKEAEADFNKSLSIAPKFFRAYGYRAFLYLETGKYQKALDDAQQSVAIEPSYAYGYLVLAQAKQKLGLKDFCVDFHKAFQLGWGEAEEAIRKYCK
jgi:tetratricopeptide (TPR) repeat protein